MWAKEEVNRVQFINENSDIHGAAPRQLHFPLNKPEYNLANKDIAGAWPNKNKFSTTREASNPLNPVYKLASFQYVAPDPPKFMRDTLYHDDIEGSRPIKAKVYEQRDLMQIDDIAGTRPKPNNLLRKTHYDSFSYADVYAKKKWTTRETNPLNPVYALRDDAVGDLTKRSQIGEVNQNYGPIKGSQPVGLKNAISGVRNLNTEDVQGAQANSRGLGPFAVFKRR